MDTVKLIWVNSLCEIPASCVVSILTKFLFKKIVYDLSYENSPQSNLTYLEFYFQIFSCLHWQ